MINNKTYQDLSSPYERDVPIARFTVEQQCTSQWNRDLSIAQAKEKSKLVIMPCMGSFRFQMAVALPLAPALLLRLSQKPQLFVLQRLVIEFLSVNRVSEGYRAHNTRLRFHHRS